MKKTVTAIIIASAVAAAVGIGTISYAAWEEAPTVIENNQMGTKTVLRFGQPVSVAITDFFPYNENGDGDFLYKQIKFSIEQGGYEESDYNIDHFILKVEVFDSDDINLCKDDSNHTGESKENLNDDKTHFIATKSWAPGYWGADWINPDTGREIFYDAWEQGSRDGDSGDMKNGEFVLSIYHDSSTLSDMGGKFKLRLTLVLVTK